MRKIAMTGATSMIGLACIDECIKNDIHVYAFVRPDSERRKDLPLSKNITILPYALDKLESIEEFPFTCDTFYHFAWENTGHRNRNSPLHQNTNIKYTLDAVRLAKKLSCKCFIGAGSQAEYGRKSGIISPQTPVNPETAYGIAKYAAGRLSSLLCSQLGLQFQWGRIFSVYGSFDNKETLIRSTIEKVLNGKKDSIAFTPCEQLWDYLYSKDAGRAFYLMGMKGKDQAIYCVGSGEVHPLRNYIIELGKKLGTDLEPYISLMPYTNGQVMSLCADIDSLTMDTGFIPQIPFSNGIELTIEWIRKNIK